MSRHGGGTYGPTGIYFTADSNPQHIQTKPPEVLVDEEEVITNDQTKVENQDETDNQVQIDDRIVVKTDKNELVVADQAEELYIVEHNTTENVDELVIKGSDFSQGNPSSRVKGCLFVCSLTP